VENVIRLGNIASCTRKGGTRGQTVRMQAAGDPVSPRPPQLDFARQRPGGHYPVVVCAVLVSIAAIAGCSQAGRVVTTTTRPPPGTAKAPGAPSIYSVTAGRFNQFVAVGGKNLLVAPPPKNADPAITGTQAAALFDADYSFQGIYAFDVLGLGLATLDQTSAQDTSYVTGLQQASAVTTTTRPATAPPSSTTTTAPPPTTTTTAPPPTTTTTAPPPTTSAPTTAPAPTTTTTAPPPTTTTTAPPAGPAAYKKTLSWIGIAVGQKPSCAGGTPSVLAMVIDAYTGHDVFQVVVPSGCGTPGSPAISRPYQLESVPWSPVGPTSTAIVVQIPACGVYVGWTELTAVASLPTQVQAAVPYDPACPTGADSKIINLVVPLGSQQSSVAHAAVGDIDNLDVLP
jgi:hypothetical protein